MPRILTRAALVTAAAAVALLPAAGAASAHEDTCDGIANCNSDLVNLGDVSVSVLDDVHLLTATGHHHR